MEKLKNSIVKKLNSKLTINQQISMNEILIDIDNYISKLQELLHNFLLKNSDLREEIQELQKQNVELRNERNYDIDNYKLIIAEIKDTETLSAIAKVVLNRGRN